MKKTDKQTKNSLQKYQAGSLLLLGGALIYFIVGQSLMEQAEYFPTTLVTPVASITQKIGASIPADSIPTEIGEIAVGTQINDQHRIDQPGSNFSDQTEKIYFSVELIYPNKGVEAQGLFYYYGWDDSKPALISSSDVTLIDSSQDAISFSLSRPGAQWQLKGKFKAIVLIPGSNAEKEIDFTIY